jgi:surfactin synthase thioesterase subunit
VLAGDADFEATLDETRQWRAHTETEADFPAFLGGHFFLADHQPSVFTLIRWSGRPVRMDDVEPVLLGNERGMVGGDRESLARQ